MRLARFTWTAATLCAALAVPSVAQVQNPPAAAGMTPEQQAQLDQAAADAAAARTAAQSAQTTASNSGTTAQSAADAAAKAQTDATAAANAAAAARAAIPTPSTTTPPGVSDSGAIGTMSTMYALANHTHASKARKGRVLIPATGALTVTFVGSDGVTPAPFAANVTPLCVTSAEATAGDTNVVNSQLDGTPTNTAVRIRITRTAITAASVLGLNILSVPTQVATYAEYVCLEP